MEKVQASVEMELGSQIVTVAPHLVPTVQLRDKILRDTRSLAWKICEELYELPDDNPLRGWVDFFERLEYQVEDMADRLPLGGDVL